MRSRWLGVGLLFLVQACGSVAGQGNRGAGRAQAVSVQTTGVERAAIQRTVDLAGTLVSPDQARVSSEVAGVVERVDVQLGQEVRPGQVLAELQSRELQLALDRAESALRQTEAQLGMTRGEKV